MTVGCRLKWALLAVVVTVGGWRVAATVPASASTQQERFATKALLVGISDYSYDTGWVDLHGGNDVDLMQAALVHRGFSPETIRTLRDSQATRQNVLQAIEEHLMSDSVGRSVVLHFSVHGQRLDDLDGDEGDGLDEALVLYAAPSQPNAGYRGERHLTDDTLARMLRRLQRAVGPQGSITVIVDACHSGAVTRTALPVRGTMAPITQFGKPATADVSATEWSSGFRDDIGTNDQTELAPLVFFSSARSGESAHEALASDGSTIVGAFTNTLVQVLLHEPELLAWGDVADVVSARVSGVFPGQHPQFTGPRDLKVFSSIKMPTERFIPLLSSVSATRLSLKGGTLVGLGMGAVVSIHRAGTHRPTDASRLARGRVVSASVFRAEVELDGPIETGAAEGARAFLDSLAPASTTVAVAVHETLPNRAAWSDALRGNPWIRLAAAAYPGVYLIEPHPGQAGDVGVVLRDPNDLDGELEVQPVGIGAGHNAIIDRLERLALTTLIRSSAVSSTEHRAQVELAPARSTGPETCQAVGPAYRQTEGRSVIVVDRSTRRAHSQLAVSNRGVAASFATVIAVDGRGWTCQLYPKRDERADRLAPGDTATICLVPDLEPGQTTWEAELWVFNVPVELDLGSVTGRFPDCGQGRSSASVRGPENASGAAALHQLRELARRAAHLRGSTFDPAGSVGHVQVRPVTVRMPTSSPTKELR